MESTDYSIANFLTYSLMYGIIFLKLKLDR